VNHADEVSAQKKFFAGDETHQRLPPRLERTQAQVVPIETQKVEAISEACAPPRLACAPHKYVLICQHGERHLQGVGGSHAS
jgi:hypothetical protein